MRELANTQTEEAIATLVAIMHDPQQPAAARVAAAKELLDRAHGKPTQTVEARMRRITIFRGPETSPDTEKRNDDHERALNL